MGRMGASIRVLVSEAGYLAIGIALFLAFCVFFYLVLSAQLEITSFFADLF